MVRRMTPEQAVVSLRFVNKAAAIDVMKAIKTALANAGRDGLAFRSIEINEGLKMRRYRMGTAGKGRGRPYHKKTSHIKIVLTDEMIGKREAINAKSKTAKVKDVKVEEPKVVEKEVVAEAAK